MIIFKNLKNRSLILFFVFLLSFSISSCSGANALPPQDVCSYWEYLSALMSIYCNQDKKLSSNNIDTMQLKSKFNEIEKILRKDPNIDNLARKLYQPVH